MVIPGQCQVSVYRTIGPTLVLFLDYLVTKVTMIIDTNRFCFRIKLAYIIMHLDNTAVKIIRLCKPYNTLFELVILFRASGCGICTHIIWLSVKICRGMVKM